MSRLPTSTEEVHSILFLAIIATLASISRVLYGRDELSWRYTVASIMVAICVSWLTYAGAVATMQEVSGYITCAIGVSAGLFTDDLLKKAGAKVRS